MEENGVVKAFAIEPDSGIGIETAENSIKISERMEMKSLVPENGHSSESNTCEISLNDSEDSLGMLHIDILKDESKDTDEVRQDDETPVEESKVLNNVENDSSLLSALTEEDSVECLNVTQIGVVTIDKEAPEICDRTMEEKVLDSKKEENKAKQEIEPQEENEERSVKESLRLKVDEVIKETLLEEEDFHASSQEEKIEEIELRIESNSSDLLPEDVSMHETDDGSKEVELEIKALEAIVGVVDEKSTEVIVEEQNEQKSVKSSVSAEECCSKEGDPEEKKTENSKSMASEDSKGEAKKEKPEKTESVESDRKSSEEPSSVEKKDSETPKKQRSVIEDIFEDWCDENTEEETNPDQHKPGTDSVEKELENLLKPVTPEVLETPEKKDSKVQEPVKDRIEEERKDPSVEEPVEEPVKKTTPEASDPVQIPVPVSSPVPVSVPESPAKKIKASFSTPKVKTPRLHVASSEVAKIVKEKFREKQAQQLEQPQKADLVFVKKITQRLSSKLGVASTGPLPGLIPLSSTNSSGNSESNSTGPEKTGAADKELLAILEGDVDPDWSNLKSPSLPAEEPVTEHSNSQKLDPSVERELALKQLLELPSVPSKKKLFYPKKKTFKPAPSKLAPKEKEEPPIESKKTVVENIVDISSDSLNETTESTKSEESPEKSRNDGFKSERKRKPTEKVRENEQLNLTKRQKVYKGKVKKDEKEKPGSAESSNEENKSLNESVKENEKLGPRKAEVVGKKKVLNEKKKNKEIPINRKGTITKKKLAVKKLIRQKVVALPNNKKVSKDKEKNDKKKKVGEKTVKRVREIDKLLQDEGVVNLLYDVEQPKKRLVPITKSQTKVMDLQKVQRELKIRTKLVRNAVLRLRTSSSGAKVTSRVSTRAVSHSIETNDLQQQQQQQQKLNNSSTTTGSSTPATGEFVFPAKIRNAADASVIVRRHSSSSFSSASGSPRVSTDTPEKQSVDTEDSGGHSLRLKRRLSQEESKGKSVDTKKSVASKKKKNEDPVPQNDEKIPVKKKLDKANKSLDESSSSNDSTPSKVMTRSTVNSTLKLNAKSKKSPKNKVTFAKAANDSSPDESKKDDELSACLAEAATALSVVTSSSSKSNSGNLTRRSKGNANATKEPESSKRNQFINKEINVKRHGALVQLILTPSTSTKLKNGFTLKVMQEFCEALTILKQDEECRVVLFTSTGSTFCEGLELSSLLHNNKEERRLRAEQIANAVKEFIRTLATFNKPIVAGVQGSAVGLGVTMLPLFDMVIASDKATFCTPYAKLGQIAEGAAVFTLSHILGSSITSELLLGGRTFTASEALSAGLVTRVIWPDRFQNELLPSLRAMSEQSAQSMEATKALLRHSLRKKLDAALDSETHLLIQHWCSAECQSTIKSYIEGKLQ